MVDLEEQLHRLLDEAAPVPPRAVNPAGARQRARKQRQHAAAAVAVVVCALAVGVMVPYLATRGQGRPTQLTTRPLPSPSSAGPLADVPAARAAGVVLAVNGDGRLVRAWPGTDRAPRPVAAQAIPGGPSLIATDAVT